MAITYNYVGAQGSSVSSTTHTFSAFAWANPAASRRIVVGFFGGTGSGAPTSLTIDGIAATMIASGSRASGGGSHHSSIWVADVPTGTVGDVVVTHASAKSRMFCAVWEVFDILSNTPADTLYADATNTGAIDVPTGGLLLAIAGYNASTSWCGRAGDYLSISAAEAGRSITLDNAGGTNLTAQAAVNVVSTTGTPDHITAVTFTPAVTEGITSVTPNSGPAAGGTPVVITGAGFTGATGATFGGVAATGFSVVSDTEINCTTPAGTAGPVDVVVVRPTTNLTLAGGFEFIPVIEARVTQTPLLVINLPVQGTQVTQTPIITVLTNRVAALPVAIIPDLPLVEIWQYYTALSRAEGSREQRAALRQSPRIILGVNALITSDDERRDIYQMMRAFIGKSFNYPIYSHATKLTAAAIAGATKLFFDPSYTDMRAGEGIAVAHPQTAIPTFYTISTVDADGATLTTPLTDDVTVNYYVCPAPLFRFRSSVGFNMQAISGAYELTLETLDLRSVLRPTQSTTLTTYDGYNVLDKRPLANDDVEEQFNDDVFWLDNKIARPEANYKWPIAFVSGKRQFIVHRNEGGLDYWRAVANATIGKQKPFLLPTFRADIPLDEQPALGATVLKSSLVQLTNYWQSPAYRYVMIASAAGTIYRKVTEVTPVHDPVTGDMVSVEIRLDASIGAGVGANEDMIVSYANVCRLDSDEIKMTHDAIDSILEIQVRMVEA